MFGEYEPNVEDEKYEPETEDKQLSHVYLSLHPQGIDKVGGDQVFGTSVAATPVNLNAPLLF
mgnify:CR=1 FL=1